MKIKLPKIIQGGMGVAVSNWHLARSVSSIGQLGIVSGTGLDQVFSCRLQDGDKDGVVRHALTFFPFQKMAQRVLTELFVPGGKDAKTNYKTIKPTTKEKRKFNELCIVSNFVEVFLAREGHSHPVGINYLEKIRFPHLPSLYGAMLAGVAVVIIGAGIPVDIPRVLDALSQHATAHYPLHVVGAPANADTRLVFNPAEYAEAGVVLPELNRPDFLPIISTDALATILLRKSGGGIQGFIVERATAGGHNAPPRGHHAMTVDGQPIYGPRDHADLEVLRRIGLPFWLAGEYGSPEAYCDAVSQGAAGVQVGTPFALCTDSGMVAEQRRALVERALNGTSQVFTDPLASPTGFPFKVAQLSGTLSEDTVYQARRRRCEIGFLQEPYWRADGTIGYRCAAEPVEAYVAKGGLRENTVGRKCICAALMAAAGYPQSLPGGAFEPPILTLGDDYKNIGRFCTQNNPEFTAADVIRTILG